MTDQEKAAALKLRELAAALTAVNNTANDGTLDDLFTAIPRLWIEVWNALQAIGFQPPEDMRRVEQHRVGALWLCYIAAELETALDAPPAAETT